MSSYGNNFVPKCEIQVPKINNLGCFGSKPYLKTPKAQLFCDQNYCWIKVIKGEKQVENLRCRAATVIKIVKNTHDIYLGLKLKLTHLDPQEI